MQSLTRVKKCNPVLFSSKAWHLEPSLPYLCFISAPSSLPEKIGVTKDMLQGTIFLFFLKCIKSSKDMQALGSDHFYITNGSWWCPFHLNWANFPQRWKLPLAEFWKNNDVWTSYSLAHSGPPPTLGRPRLTAQAWLSTLVWTFLLINNWKQMTRTCPPMIITKFL